MSTVYRSPKNKKEFKEYFNFRWELLRKPLGLKLGSEQDELEDSAFHIAAYHSNKLVGVGRLQLEADLTSRIRYMAVHEKYRSRGIGSQILKELEKIAANHQAKTCWLYARETAVSFYLKNNYKIKGEANSKLNIKHQRMEKSF